MASIMIKKAVHESIQNIIKFNKGDYLLLIKDNLQDKTQHLLTTVQITKDGNVELYQALFHFPETDYVYKSIFPKKETDEYISTLELETNNSIIDTRIIR